VRIESIPGTHSYVVIGTLDGVTDYINTGGAEGNSYRAALRTANAWAERFGITPDLPVEGAPETVYAVMHNDIVVGLHRTSTGANAIAVKLTKQFPDGERYTVRPFNVYN
jgi:hypothetical protein